MRPLLAATPLVALTLMLAACGGGDDDATTTAATERTTTTADASISRDEYVARADAICRAGDAAVERASVSAVRALGTDRPTQAQLETIAVEVGIPLIEKQSADLQALPLPTEDTEAARALWTDFDAGLAEAKKNPGPIITGEGPSAVASTDAKAKAFGLRVCGAG